MQGRCYRCSESDDLFLSWEKQTPQKNDLANRCADCVRALNTRAGSDRQFQLGPGSAYHGFCSRCMDRKTVYSSWWEPRSVLAETTTPDPRPLQLRPKEDRQGWYCVNCVNSSSERKERPFSHNHPCASCGTYRNTWFWGESHFARGVCWLTGIRSSINEESETLIAMRCKSCIGIGNYAWDDSTDSYNQKCHNCGTPERATFRSWSKKLTTNSTITTKENKIMSTYNTGIQIQTVEAAGGYRGQIKLNHNVEIRDEEGRLQTTHSVLWESDVKEKEQDAAQAALDAVTSVFTPKTGRSR